jgi:hypothetical protein
MGSILDSFRNFFKSRSVPEPVRLESPQRLIAENGAVFKVEEA